MKSKADLFIIESLNPDDEGNGRFEGPNIAHIARLHGKQPAYRYVRTRKQLAEAIAEFHSSHYRYLHISAHADRAGIGVTNGDEISNAELGEMLGRPFAARRLFLSACEVVHKQMAGDIIPATRCYSVVGPRRNIGFAEAVVFWPALYHLMFKVDAESMKRSVLAESLRKVSALFEVEIGFYARSQSRKSGFTQDILGA